MMQRLVDSTVLEMVSLCYPVAIFFLRMRKGRAS